MLVTRFLRLRAVGAGREVEFVQWGWEGEYVSECP